MAFSTARVIVSPTTAPIEPPMKAYSIALTMTGLPLSLPRALMMASFSPVSRCERLQAIGIGLEVGKLQRIGGDQVAVFGLVFAVVQQVGEPGAGVDAEVAIALGADVEVLVEVLLPDDLAALVALDPEAFGLYPLLARSVELCRVPA